MGQREGGFHAFAKSRLMQRGPPFSRRTGLGRASYGAWKGADPAAEGDDSNGHYHARIWIVPGAGPMKDEGGAGLEGLLAAPTT